MTWSRGNGKEVSLNRAAGSRLVCTAAGSGGGGGAAAWQQLAAAAGALLLQYLTHRWTSQLNQGARAGDYALQAAGGALAGQDSNRNPQRQEDYICNFIAP